MPHIKNAKKRMEAKRRRQGTDMARAMRIIIKQMNKIEEELVKFIKTIDMNKLQELAKEAEDEHYID